LFSLIVFLSANIVPAFAQSEQAAESAQEQAAAAQPQALEELKVLTGEIVQISLNKEPKMIGITYEEDGADYYFPIVEDTKVVHKNSLEELSVGDIVEITFKQISKKDADNNELIDREAKMIKFVRPAKQEDDLNAR